MMYHTPSWGDPRNRQSLIYLVDIHVIAMMLTNRLAIASRLFVVRSFTTDTLIQYFTRLQKQEQYNGYKLVSYCDIQWIRFRENSVMEITSHL